MPAYTLIHPTVPKATRKQLRAMHPEMPRPGDWVYVFESKRCEIVTDFNPNGMLYSTDQQAWLEWPKECVHFMRATDMEYVHAMRATSEE